MGLKRVHVDASDKKRLITMFAEGEKRVLWDSTLNYGENLETHETEYVAIICALRNYAGDLEIVTDSESIVKVLNGEGRVRDKSRPYVKKIREMSKDRVVKFSYERRDMNIASLKQQGYALIEIFDPNLKKRKQERKENMKKKLKKHRMKRKGQRSTP